MALTVTNAGTVAGAEVAQLYLEFPAAANEPSKVLKGYAKTASLAAGESAKLELVVPAKDLNVWDNVAWGWAAVVGDFGVHVGASSRDIRLNATVLV